MEADPMLIVGVWPPEEISGEDTAMEVTAPVDVIAQTPLAGM